MAGWHGHVGPTGAAPAAVRPHKESVSLEKVLL